MVNRVSDIMVTDDRATENNGYAFGLARRYVGGRYTAL